MDKPKEFKEVVEGVKLSEVSEDAQSATLLPAAIEGEPAKEFLAQEEPDLLLAPLPDLKKNSRQAPDFADIHLNSKINWHQLSDPERLMSLFKNKNIVVAIVFVALQCLLLLQLQNAKTYLLLGEMSAFNQTQLNNSGECFREALLLNPHLYEAAAQEAHVCFYQNDFKSAVQYANQSLSIAKNGLAYNVLGDVALSKGNIKDAADAFQSLLTFTPNDPIALGKLGWCKKQLGDLKGSADLYKRAVQIKSDAASDFHHFGYDALTGEHAQRENPAFSVVMESLALDLGIENIDIKRLWYAHMNRAQAYNHMFKPSLALADSEFVISKSPDKDIVSGSYDNLKESNRLLGNYDELEKDSLAESKAGGWSENWSDIAEVKLFEKNYQAALKDANNALSDYPNDGWPRLIKNYALDAMHKKAEFKSSLDYRRSLPTEIKKLKAHGLDKRAADLQSLLTKLDENN